MGIWQIWKLKETAQASRPRQQNKMQYWVNRIRAKNRHVWESTNSRVCHFDDVAQSRSATAARPAAGAPRVPPRPLDTQVFGQALLHSDLPLAADRNILLLRSSSAACASSSTSKSPEYQYVDPNQWRCLGYLLMSHEYSCVRHM